MLGRRSVRKREDSKWEIYLVHRPNEMVEVFIIDTKLALTVVNRYSRVSHDQRSTSYVMFERNCISIDG